MNAISSLSHQLRRIIYILSLSAQLDFALVGLVARVLAEMIISKRNIEKVNIDLCQKKRDNARGFASGTRL